MLRRKPPTPSEREAKGKLPAYLLNPGEGSLTGAMPHGALVGQSKISAELRTAVDTPGVAGTAAGLAAYEPVRQLGAGASGVVHLVRWRPAQDSPREQHLCHSPSTAPEGTVCSSRRAPKHHCAVQTPLTPGAGAAPPPPPLVLSGHAASLTPY